MNGHSISAFMMNLHGAFLEQVERHADKTALCFGPESFTYAQLARQAGSVAAALRRRWKVEPGDRVGIWLRNQPTFVPALFGILQAGAVVVPINHFFKPEEIAHLIQDAGVRVLITEPDLAPGLDHLPADCPPPSTLLSTAFEDLPPAPHDWGDADPRPDQLAALIYTSGTTGRPKGAMLTHGNFLHNVRSCQQALEITEEERIAVLLPQFHSFMLTVGTLLPLLSGAGIVLIKSLHPPKNVVMELAQHRATLLPAIPQFFRALAANPLPAGLALRLCISGAAPLPVDTLESFNARNPVPLLEGYGLSEASPVVSLNPIRGIRKPGSIGLPIPGVELTIRDDAGRELPRGQIGELCVRGGNVMLGYWNQPEATAETLQNGWLRTGDVGYQDTEGYTFITDRKKDMLLVNGINVYPREIEEFLYQFPGIRDAAVIGRPDPRKGEHPVAYLSLREGHHLDRHALRDYLRQHRADYKIPRRFYVLPELPRNGTGKILKTTLRQLPDPPEC